MAEMRALVLAAPPEPIPGEYVITIWFYAQQMFMLSIGVGWL